MRPSISFLTSTTRIAPPVAAAATGDHRLELLGISHRERALYFLERVHAPRAAADVPQLLVMFLDGDGAGRLAPVLGWYLGSAAEVAARFEQRLRALRAELSPLDAVDPDGWELNTRIAQRHALTVAEGHRAIRSFALTLEVAPIIEPPQPRAGSSLGRTAVTAYLHARAHLDGIWAVPGEPLAVARVSYVGVLSDTGHTKQTAVLARRSLH